MTYSNTGEERELIESKDRIEYEIGHEISSFSYPYAFPEQDSAFCHMLRNMLVNSGYILGVTTAIGSVYEFDDRIFLKRLPINAYDDQLLFQAKIEGAYNWLYLFQFATKKVKHFLGES